MFLVTGAAGVFGVAPVSIVIVIRGVMSPTLYVHPTLFVIHSKFLGGDYGCTITVAITVTYQVIIHPSPNHPWQYFITSC